MDYQRLRSVEQPPKELIRESFMTFTSWEKKWKDADWTHERIGLLHQIYGTLGSGKIVFRHLLEIADEYHGLNKFRGKSDRHGYSKADIASVALEIAAKRQLKADKLYELYTDPEKLACFFWFFRVEDGKVVNRNLTGWHEPQATHVDKALEELCVGVFERKDDALAQYRPNAVRILAALNKLSLIVPRRGKNILEHPWNRFDEASLQTLEELAIQDAQRLGGTSVDFALVHGSEPAAVYIAAKHAEAALAQLRRK